MRLPSPSKLLLAQLCQHPFTSGHKWPYDESDAANYGKADHKWCEMVVGRQVFSPAMIAHLYDLTPSETRQLEADAWTISDFIESRRPSWEWAEAERIVAYDVNSGSARFLKDFRFRRRSEIVTVIDLVYRRLDGQIGVFDLKTGRQRYTSEAGTNPQMLFAAMVVSKLYGVDSVTVELGYVEPGEIVIDPADVTDFAIEAFVGELDELVVKLSGGPTPPIPGPHCTQQFCPLRGHCSATRAALAELAPPGYDLTAIKIESAEQAARMYRLLPQAEAVLAAVKEAVKTWAREQPIELENGHIYAWREKSKREVKIDGNAKAVEALQAVLGAHSDEAIDTKVHASISSIKKAARLVAKQRGTKIVDVELEAMAALEAAGGVVTSRWESPEEFERMEQEL